MEMKRLVRYVLVAVLALALGVLLGERRVHAETMAGVPAGGSAVIVVQGGPAV